MTAHLHIFIKVVKARHIGGTVTHHQVRVVAFEMGDDLCAGRRLVKEGPGKQDNGGLTIMKAAAWPHRSTAHLPLLPSLTRENLTPPSPRCCCRRRMGGALSPSAPLTAAAVASLVTAAAIASLLQLNAFSHTVHTSYPPPTHRCRRRLARNVPLQLNDSLDGRHGLQIYCHDLGGDGFPGLNGGQVQLAAEDLRGRREEAERQMRLTD